MDEDEKEDLGVSVRNVAEEEERIAEQLSRDAADGLQDARKRRVDKLTEQAEEVEKELRELETKSPHKKGEISAKRRRLADVRIREQEAQLALQAAEKLGHDEGQKESERERLLRLGIITPFDVAGPKEEAVTAAAEEDAIASAHDGKTSHDKLKDGEPELINAEEDDEPEAAPRLPDHVLDGGLKIPGDVHEKLFPYQRTGVRWMWELHGQDCGGIIGDEMGLGKTVQVVAFLASLEYSEKLDGPVLVIVPATLLQQWRREISVWWDGKETCILHQSELKTGDSSKTVNKALKAMWGTTKVMVTTYEMVRRKRDPFIRVPWAYVILDEGHRIRNPDADITITCKRFETAHRIIMSGSPVQNRLRELWSLFDFIFPGKLGTLPVFEREFSTTIGIGGYATASAAQIHTAYHCALVLRDLISPYILRRMKKDVAIQLPNKQEQLLLCKMTDEQKQKYKDYLGSREIRSVLSGHLNMLAAVTVLRKICNHPDLVEKQQPEDYGSEQRSGKLRVLAKVLVSWNAEGHRLLLFAQTTTLLDLLEKFVNLHQYSYLRMDGGTPVARRMAMIDQFNNDEGIFIFLLTTKVGGFGINLTGADRVVLYEPDWNPSNDLQARERAWRIGQKKNVTIYRLVTSGTIEEKIYHRQIYKQYLSSKVLNDPKQRRFFKAKDLNDLFTFKDEDKHGTETGDLFAGTDAKEVTKTRHEQEQNDPEEEGEVDDDQDRSRKGDAGMLQKLFETDGLHSAMDHDNIVKAGEANVDLDVIEHEAVKIAKQAARELRKSRRERQELDVSVPTWTGRSGDAGRVTIKKRFGTPGGRASKILDKVQERSGDASQKDVDENLRLMEDITQFLQSQGGEATTLEIVDHFKDRVSGKGMITFKALLQRVASMPSKSSTGASKWILRTDFQVPEAN